MPITGLKPLFFHYSLVRQGLDDLYKSDGQKAYAAILSAYLAPNISYAISTPCADVTRSERGFSS